MSQIMFYIEAQTLNSKRIIDEFLQSRENVTEWQDLKCSDMLGRRVRQLSLSHVAELLHDHPGIGCHILCSCEATGIHEISQSLTDSFREALKTIPWPRVPHFMPATIEQILGATKMPIPLSATIPNGLPTRRTLSPKHIRRHIRATRARTP